jgi:hypothetical protein
LVHDLLYEVAQLDLLASPPVREAARRLAVTHQRVVIRLGENLPDPPGKENYPYTSGEENYPYMSGEESAHLRWAIRQQIEEFESALVERTRTDLGLGSSRQVLPHSLLAQLLGWDQE